MQQAIDEEKMTKLTTMDVNKPPTKEIGFQEFPRLVYLHPRDKAKEQKFKQVESKEELEAALKRGYRLDAHVPVRPAEAEADAVEYEVAQEAEAKPKAGANPKKGKPSESEGQV